VTDAGAPLPNLDETLHARARLGIMTLLVQWGKGDFPTLKKFLDLTDGNLGAHIRVLDEAGYVTVDKTFAGRKPKTTVKVTAAGRKAFQAYLAELQRLIELAGDKP
jgi:DNA-binding MarR family transcriptional regulator